MKTIDFHAAALAVKVVPRVKAKGNLSGLPSKPSNSATVVTCFAAYWVALKWPQERDQQRQEGAIRDPAEPSPIILIKEKRRRKNGSQLNQGCPTTPKPSQASNICGRQAARLASSFGEEHAILWLRTFSPLALMQSQDAWALDTRLRQKVAIPECCQRSQRRRSPCECFLNMLQQYWVQNDIYFCDCTHLDISVNFLLRLNKV